MSEAYERERQNNSRLDELSAKVSALRGVTIDIYDNARAQDVIDNTVRLSYFCILIFCLPVSGQTPYISRGLSFTREPFSLLLRWDGSLGKLEVEKKGQKKYMKLLSANK